MLRFVVAGVVTVTLFLVGAGLGLVTQGEPPVPHVRLADRASTIAETPGSNLEGIGTAIGPVMALARVVVENQAAAYAAEIAAAVAREDGPSQSAAAVDYESDGAWTWDDTARCETGGDWSMQGSSYSGGLGFANSTWDAYGGQEFAPNAGMATREQQIEVAERIQSTPGGCHGW